MKIAPPFLIYRMYYPKVDFQIVYGWFGIKRFDPAVYIAGKDTRGSPNPWYGHTVLEDRR